jgi:hypothetical protein
MIKVCLRIAAAILCVASFGLAQSARDARMNQIQVLGSHNSYKQAIDPSLLSLLQKKLGDRARGVEY